MAKSKIEIKIEKEIKDLEYKADNLYHERAKLLAQREILNEMLKDK